MAHRKYRNIGARRFNKAIRSWSKLYSPTHTKAHRYQVTLTVLNNKLAISTDTFGRTGVVV